MGLIAPAHGKTHAELRVELRKLVHAGELVLGAGAGAHVEGDAVLVPRGPPLDDAATLLGLDHAGPAGTGAFLAFTHAALLLRRAVCGGDRDVTVHGHECLEE